MGSFKRPRAFDPLDLEIIDRVYEAVWAQIEAREIDRDSERDPERQQTLREHIFAVAGMGPVDFDALYDRVLETLHPSERNVVHMPVSADFRQSSTD
jgi:hypothetical protein